MGIVKRRFIPSENQESGVYYISGNLQSSKKSESGKPDQSGVLQAIIYEAGIRNIPIYFYDYDLDKYNDDRGLAIDIKELPGFIENDPKKLVADLNKEYDYKYLKSFINKYVSNTKDCTKKICDEIDKFMK